jgi:hypothetical protein
MTDDELLSKYAQRSQIREGEWWISNPSYTQPPEKLAPFIRAQLELGVRVTDIMEMSAWTVLVQRLVHAEERITELSRAHDVG